jgi:hypothetical protein
MAIDPTISLQQPTVKSDPIGSMTAGIGMAKNMQDIATARAALPSVQAKAVLDTAKSTLQQKMLLNQDQFMDADGNVDFGKLSSFAARNGGMVGVEVGQAFAGKNLENQKQAIANSTSAQEFQQRTKEAVNAAQDHEATLLEAMMRQGVPEDQIMARHNQLRAGAAQFLPKGAITEENWPSVYDASRYPAIAEATMTPQQKRQQDNANQQTKNATVQVEIQQKQLGLDVSGRQVKGQEEYNTGSIYANGMQALRDLPEQKELENLSKLPAAEFQKQIQGNPKLTVYYQALEKYNAETGSNLKVWSPRAAAQDAFRNQGNIHNKMGDAWMNTTAAPAAIKSTPMPPPSKAPAAAEASLMSNPTPERQATFKAHFGYLPTGL